MLAHIACCAAKSHGTRRRSIGRRCHQGARYDIKHPGRCSARPPPPSSETERERPRTGRVPGGAAFGSAMARNLTRVNIADRSAYVAVRSELHRVEWPRRC